MILSITVSGRSYQIDATDAQIAGLGAARSRVMAALSPPPIPAVPDGETPPSQIPIEQWPGYIATDVAYLESTLTNWVKANPNGDVAAMALQCLASWSGVVPDPVVIAAVPLSPEAKIASLIAYASNKRWQVETGGIVVNGVPIPTDDRAKLLLLGAATGMVDGSSAPMVVNGVNLGMFPKAVFQAINAAVIAHVQSTFPVLASVIANINTGATMTTAQIDAVAWPKNS